MQNLYTSTGLIDTMAQQLVTGGCWVWVGWIPFCVCWSLQQTLGISTWNSHWLICSQRYSSSILKKRQCVHTYVGKYFRREQAHALQYWHFLRKQMQTAKVAMEYALELHTNVKMIMWICHGSPSCCTSWTIGLSFLVPSNWHCMLMSPPPTHTTHTQTHRFSCAVVFVNNQNKQAILYFYVCTLNQL